MALRRTDDMDRKDLTAPYYTVSIVLRKVAADNPDGTTSGEEVVVEGPRMDLSLININKVLAAAGKDPIVEPAA